MIPNEAYNPNQPLIPYKEPEYVVKYHIMYNPTVFAIQEKQKMMPEKTFIFIYTTFVDYDYSELNSDYIMKPTYVGDVVIGNGTLDEVCNDVTIDIIKCYTVSTENVKIERIL